MGNLDGAMFATAGILLVLAVIACALRCYARIGIMKSFGADDWLMMLSLLFFIVYCSWVFYGARYKQGEHLEDIPVADYSHDLMAIYFGEVFFVLTALCLKLSIGTFLLRIVEARAQRYTIYGTLLIVGLFSAAYFFLAVFQCHPINYYWNRFNSADGTCLTIYFVQQMVYAQSVIYAASDFILAGIPIFLVRKLHMNRFMKISVAGLMGLGAFAGVTTIIRMPFIRNLTRTTDLFYNMSILTIVTTFEPGIGIIIGSAAALRPLFKSLSSKSIFGSTRNKSTKQSGNSSRSTPWQSSRSQDRHYRLNSLQTQGSQIHTTVVEGGDPTRNGETAITNKKNGGSGITSNQNSSQEELTPSSRNIYKETSVERRVEIYPSPDHGRDRDRDPDIESV